MSRLVGQEEGGDFIPNRRGAGDTGSNIRHGSIVVVADPDSYQSVSGVADGPVITQVLSGAGFDGDLVTGDVKN